MEQIVQTTANSTNPLLSRVKIPGETIRLPSNGIFYVNGEISQDVTDGEIHLYPLTTMSEILLRSPDKLLNGEALIEVLMQSAPQVLKPMDLLSKDVDYILTALRKVTYGDVIEIKYQHTCENAKEHTYGVSLSRILGASKVIDPTTLNQVFALDLPNGQVVKLQPMRFKNVIEIMQSVQSVASDDKMIGEQLIKSVSYMISAVDEISDPVMISEWLNQIPTTWFNDISKTIERISDWGPVFEYKDVCLDCGQEVELSVSLNPLTFFM
jgi:hypothetical protein